MYSLNHLFMSKAEHVNSELRKRSQAEFDVAKAKPARVREPQRS